MATGLAILNASPQVLQGPALLHQLLSQTILDGRTAIEYTFKDGRREELTYPELHHQSDSLASKILATRPLTHQTHGERFVVPLYMEQSLELYISQIAILKAGGAFCPIALDVPEERLRFILRDTGATLLLTTAAQRGKLPEIEGVQHLTIDYEQRGRRCDPVQVEVSPTDAAYIMYTSGSTGQPKGVVVSHSAVTQALLAHDRHIPSFSRFLNFASPTFDVSVFEIFFPLFRGCTLVSCDRGKMLNDLPGVINELNVDAAELTPSVTDTLLHGRGSVPSLRLLLTIGEKMRQSVVDDFGGNTDAASILWALYGPTEAAIHCTLQTSFDVSMSVGDIGVPLDTVSAFILKPAQQIAEPPEILALGEEGELVIGGHQLADGYLNRDEQTKAAFVHHPVYGRLYRTGDRARIRADGHIECFGRISSGQIKLRGQRIELGEIEYAASRTPGCKTVVSDVVEGALVVFCVLTDSAKTQRDDVLITCRSWLPGHMIPSDVIFMSRLPYLASGKLDRSALHLSWVDKRIGTDVEASPLDPRLVTLAEIVSGTLSLDINQDTYLPGAGIDSLSAIRLASSLRRRGYPQLDAASLLEVANIAELDAMLQEDIPTSSLPEKSREGYNDTISAAVSVPLHLTQRRDDIQSVYLCSPVQAAMLAETNRAPRAYCNWIEFRVPGINVERMEEVLRALISQHGTLRTGFVAPSDGHPHRAIVWKDIDPAQIQIRNSFERDYRIDSDGDILHPCAFQLVLSESAIEILLCIHHALYDQWSMDLLKRDLNILLAGGELEPALQYQTVSGFYTKSGSDKDQEDDVDFWRDHLRAYSSTPIPQLNTTRVDAALRRTEWRTSSLRMQDLKAVTRKIGCTPPAVFQAALAYLLGAYAGSTDITFGTVFSGRHVAVPGIEGVFGPCLATLPCRVDLSSTRTSADLIRLVQVRNRAMQSHALTPGTTIKQAGQCPPGTLLFDTLFVWQESTIIVDDEDTPQVVELTDSADSHEFNLVVEFEPRTGGVAIRATYQQSLLPTAQVELFIQQISAVAQYMVTSPHAPMSDLGTSLWSELLSIANPNPRPSSTNVSLVSLIESHAQTDASSPALLFISDGRSMDEDVTTMSYQQLNERANQLAHHLDSLNVTAGDLICVCMEKSIDLYVSVLAVLKTGAGYLPLLPDTPSARLQTILGMASAKLCLVDQSSVQQVRAVTSIPCILLEDIELSREPTHNLATAYRGSDVAYAVFTSGSTGEPKGVAVTMDNLSGNLAALIKLYDVHSGDRLLQACSQAFDVSVFEIFFAWTSAMCLCSATKTTVFQDIEALIRRLKITHLSLTPTVASLIDPANVPSVRFLVTAGEAVTESVHRKWSGHGLHQGYGPSETTNILSVNMNVTKDHHLANVGPPLENTSAFVVDAESDELILLPHGSIGELVFGGEQIFQGYLAMPELNSQKLINHPRYGRLYRSGDIGRILCDGSLSICGRLDDQVKILGNRIELGEVSATVMRSHKVKDCATLTYDSGSSSKAIVTFWVPLTQPHDSFDGLHVLYTETKQSTEVYDSISSSLPAYMLPLLIPITTMPLTAQGKLDKRACLGLLNDMTAEVRSGFSQATALANDDQEWSEVECELAKVLVDTLGLAERPQRHTSFLALGVNSLGAISFAKAIEKQTGMRTTIDSILRYPSVARLAKFLQDSTGSSTSSVPPLLTDIFSKDKIAKSSALVASRGLEVDRVLPCTPLQITMLVASVSDSSGAYCNCTTLNVEGSVKRLEKCWLEVMTRHDILRTIFVETEDAERPYAQIVLRQMMLPWTIVNAIVPEELHTQAQVTLDRPWHITVYQSRSTCSLILQMHHAVYDGSSMAILFEEVEHLYNGEVLDAAPKFDSYLAHVESQNTGAAVEYWNTLVQSFSPVPFPALRMATAVGEDTLRTTLSKSLRDIDALCKSHQLHPLSVIQAAWAKALSVAQSSSDVCFGNVVSGRSLSIPGIDRLVAPTFNTIPVRVQIPQRQSNKQMILALQTQSLASLPYQLTALRKIQSNSKTPEVHLFDSLLLLQPPYAKLNSTIWRLAGEKGAMSMPLVIEIVPSSLALEAVLHFQTPRFSTQLAQALLQAFDCALVQCIDYVHSSVTDFGAGNVAAIEGKLVNLNSGASRSHRPETVASIGDDTPWSPAEQIVRQVFAALATVDERVITKNTSMYRIGLDSLNAAQVAAKLRARGLTVGAADVMELQTSSAIASASEQTRRPPENPRSGVDLSVFDRHHRQQILSDNGLRSEDVRAVWPCTPVQAGMLAQSVETNGELYINHLTYLVPANVSLGEILTAWQRTQRRHQVLRMGFIQTNTASEPFALLVYNADTQSLPSSSHEEGPDSLTEVAAREDIMGHLHEPAWRLSIRERGKFRTMRLSIHHALYDAHSLGIILGDFSKALRGDTLGPSSDIESTLKFELDVASNVSRDAERFWTNAVGLDNTPARFPDLTPTTIKKGALKSFERHCGLSATDLDQYCRSHGITIQALGQSVFAQLIAAYVGSPTVTFGTVFSGHVHGSREVAFPSINTVPVVCNTNVPFADLLSKMLHYNATAQKHRHTSLSQIQRIAGRPGQSLFDTVFVYQKTISAAEDGLDWLVVRESAAVDYAVSLELLVPPASGIELRLTINSAVISDEQASIFLEQYESLMSAQIADEDVVTHISPHLLSIVAAKRTDIPSAAVLLHNFVEITAERYPDRSALEFLHSLDGSEGATQKWTYKQLDQRGNQVALMIRSHVIPTGSIIAVCMNKCPEASFAFLGILKSGCSFLAIDPDLPTARRDFILKDSDSQLLLVNPGMGSDEKQSCVPWEDISEKNLVAQGDERLPTVSIRPDDTCYCLYTSGTTGNPKGCLISHESAVQAMQAFHRLFAGHWNASSKWLQFASYWFDVCVLEHFWSWSAGITVVGAPRDLVLEDLAGFLRAAAITHLDLTPSLARLLRPEDVPSLANGVFLTGGDALKREIIDAWGAERVVCNAYGPTEATIGVTMNTFIGADAKPSNIGKAFDNVGTYVLEPDSERPVLRGAVGELCVSGKLVGKGYLNRPDITARQFPTLSAYGERVYRTGDLVRILADDSFLFVGRKDTQAKLRGQRLEVAEIDAVVKATSSDIAEVLTTVLRMDGDKEILVTFMSTGSASSTRKLDLDDSPKARTLIAGVRQACASRLPAYMIPTHIVPTQALPLTVNNKIDTKKLKALFSSVTIKTLNALQNEKSETLALSANELEVCKVVCKMLGVNHDVVGRESNIFSLGLSSISAISLASLLKRAGFGRASVAMIMKNPKINQLAAVLTEPSNSYSHRDVGVSQAKLIIAAFSQRQRISVMKKLDLRSDEIEAVTPCTPLQEGMLLESLRQPDHPYFNEFQYQLLDVDTARLKRSLDAVVEQVQILKARFLQTEDGFAQVISRKRVCPWYESVDVTGGDDGRVLQQKRQAWLGLNQEDLLVPIEAHLLRSGRLQLLIFFVHHALYDGISWDLVLDLLWRTYHSAAVPDVGPRFTAALPHGPMNQQPNSKNFWEARLQGFHTTPLPTLPGTKPGVTTVVASWFKTDAKLERTRRKLAISHHAFMQGCFEVSLHHQFRCETYGVTVSGRSINFAHADLVIGPLFNTLPSIIGIRGTDTWSSLFRRLDEDHVSAMPHQHTPLSAIRKWCCKDMAGSMFDVLFVFQHESQSAAKQSSPGMSPVDQAPRAAYPLALEVTLKADDSISITAVAQSSHADKEMLRTLVNNFERALLRACEQSDELIGTTFEVEESSLSSVAAVPIHIAVAPDLNGVHDFEWSNEADCIRQAIASVGNFPSSDVDEHVTLFSLGLDSIDAVKLVSRLKKSGINIALSKLLKAQTIPRILAASEKTTVIPKTGVQQTRLDASIQMLRDFLLPTLPSTADVEKILPATPLQEALIADMIRSDLKEYYNHDIMVLRTDTDLSKLRAAWQTVIDKTPILRTQFVQVSDPSSDVVYAQVIIKPAQLTTDCHELQSRALLDALLENIRREAGAALSIRPPTRVTFVDIKGARHLILSLAHAQYDGHSLALLHHDVQQVYSGAELQRPPPENIIDASLNAINDEAKDFWSNTLTSAVVTRFPQKFEFAGQSKRSERICRISTDTARSFCQSHGCSMLSLAQLCWALLLAHYTRRLDVIFGVVLACRDSEEAEQVVFPTMNTVPLRAVLYGRRSEMLKYMQSVIDDARPYQRTPLRTIQAVATKVDQRGEQYGLGGLFDTLFIYQHRPDTAAYSVEPLYDSIGGSSSVEYPVAVELEAVAGQLIVRAACKSNVLDEHGTAELLARYDDILASIIASPEQATVQFITEDLVSVCGLPSISLDATTTQTTNTLDHVSEIDSTEAVELSPTAQTVRQILAQVAKVSSEDIAPSATIESIGIDSISAIKVAALLRKSNVVLTVSEIMRTKTVLRMAALAEEKAGQTAPVEELMSAKDIMATALHGCSVEHIGSSLGLAEKNIETVLPATAGQVYMLSYWQMSAGQLFYPTFTYTLSMTASIEQLRRAWSRLVVRHPILRTIFYCSDDSKLPVLQVVLRETSPAFTHGEQARTAPDAQVPMVSLHVVKHNDVWLLSLKIHHALYDAVSLPLLMRDLCDLLPDDIPTPSRSTPTQEDFLAFSHSLSAAESRKNFWTTYLHSANPVQLTHSPIHGQHSRVELFRPNLLPSISALETLARSSDLTLQALLFATWAKLYAALATPQTLTPTTGAKPTDVLLGVYLANRAHLPNLEALAAPTINIVPLLIRSPGTRPLLELAKQIQKDLGEIGSAENSAVGLWEVLEWTGLRVHTFVNFLKLPEVEDEHDEQNDDGRGYVLEELSEKRTSSYARVTTPEPTSSSETGTGLLGLEGVADAHESSIDIEATVAHGSLDVGLFCPVDMLGLEGAENAVAGVRDALQELV